MTESTRLLEFVIDGITPDRLPMSRFAEYVARLSTLLGHKENVHFVALNVGSSSILHAVEEDAAQAVTERVVKVRAREADAEAMSA
jgi:hypothetical protein